MNIYKHYSFDLWMTLIKSNPVFKQERALFFYDRFNRKNKSREQVTHIFRQVDLLCNAINEKTGGNIEAEEMYLMVIAAMNDYSYSFAEINLGELYGEMELLFFKYLPVVYSPETLTVLSRLQEKGDTTFSLLSNTAFIKGSTLRKALRTMDLERFFDFQLYSDETGLSKPNKKLFQLMLNEIVAARPGIHASDIIHIGDNEKADIEGAKTVGINSLLVNSNNNSITILLNYDRDLFLT